MRVGALRQVHHDDLTGLIQTRRSVLDHQIAFDFVKLAPDGGGYAAHQRVKVVVGRQAAPGYRAGDLHLQQRPLQLIELLPEIPGNLNDDALSATVAGLHAHQPRPHLDSSLWQCSQT